MNAVILTMPAKVQRAAKQRQTKVDLTARSRWLHLNSSNWPTEKTDGAEYWNINMDRLSRMIREHLGRDSEPTMAHMRADIAKCRARIHKRNRVKQWLAQQGADTDAVSSAESALFFLFDQANAP
jgi:hypothetical protein